LAIARKPSTGILPTRFDAAAIVMKPSISILDHSFRYVPSVATSVAETWRRFGWRPAMALERSRRYLSTSGAAPQAPRLAPSLAVVASNGPVVRGPAVR
jgi:hypothetical protein